jgi:hypothetical protein
MKQRDVKAKRRLEEKEQKMQSRLDRNKRSKGRTTKMKEWKADAYETKEKQINATKDCKSFNVEVEVD